MKLPIDLGTAKKLREKGFMSDRHYDKIEKLHKDIEAVGKKFADGGMAIPASLDPNPPAGTDQAGMQPINMWESPPGYVESQPEQKPDPSQIDMSKPGAAYMVAPGVTTPAPSVVINQPNAETGIGGQKPQMQKAGYGELATDQQLPSMQAPMMQPPNLESSLAPFDLAEKAQRDAARAEMLKGNEQANIMDNLAKKLSDQQDMINQNESEMRAVGERSMSELDARLNSLAEKKIDPNRMWANASTESKVLASIGLFMGAFSRTGVNPALEVINQSIDRDIKAQMADIQNETNVAHSKQNLFSENMQIYKNKTAALAATKAALLNQAELQTRAVAARYSGPEALAKANIAIAALEQQKNQQKSIVAQAQMQQYAAQNPQAYKEFLPKDQRERLVPGYVGMVTQPGIAKELIDFKGDVDSSKDTIDQMIQISKTGDKTDLPTRQRAAVLAQTLVGQMRKPLFGPGTFSDTEQELARDLIANPTAILSLDANTQAKLTTLKGKLQNMVDSKAKAAGLMPVNESKGLRPLDLATPPKPYSGSIKQVRLGK